MARTLGFTEEQAEMYRRTPEEAQAFRNESEYQMTGDRRKKSQPVAEVFRKKPGTPAKTTVAAKKKAPAEKAKRGFGFKRTEKGAGADPRQEIMSADIYTPESEGMMQFADKKGRMVGPRAIERGNITYADNRAGAKPGSTRTSKHRLLTNLPGEQLSAMGMNKDLTFDPGRTTHLGEVTGDKKFNMMGRERKLDALDGDVVFTDLEGNSRNSTDAYYENAMADSKHRIAMMREAGKASERAGDGKVRTLGQGRSRGRFGALARMAGARRGREDQMKRERLGIAREALELEKEKALMGPSVHPSQAKMWEAQAQKYGADALAQMSVKDKTALEERLAKDKNYMELYREFAKAEGTEAQKAAGQALNAYKHGLVYKLLVPGQEAKSPWFGRNTPATEDQWGWTTPDAQ